MLQAQYKTFSPLAQTAFLPLMKKLGPANFKKREFHHLPSPSTAHSTQED